MKKPLIILLMCFGFVAGYAQNKAVRKASSHLEKGELAEAKAQIDQAVVHEKTLDEAKTWFTKGQVYSAIATSEDESVKNLAPEALKEAATAFRKAMELEGKESAPMYVFAQQELENLWGQMINQGATSYEAANYEEAVKFFDRALLVKPTDTTAALYAGVAAQQMGNQDLASTYFYKLVETGNADKDIFNTLIAYERDQKENFEKAQALIDQAQAKYPDDVQFKKQEVSLLLKQDKTAEAKTELEQAIAAEPNNPDLYFNLGYLNEELGDAEAAIAAYKKALEVDPKHANSAFNLAVIHYNRAADLIKEANSLGISAADRKKTKELEAKAKTLFTEALPFLEQALALHPDNRTIMEITMVAYDRAGMTDKANALQKKVDSMPVE
ncbi:tetratricopeptide repeat protein [Nafulsella turpanensis]|uniref:tetratricopeptide repeat protein n=1 Tax=Nafulsella turpanensis TaxID=1265690 RepID=UPI0003458801|nr:tetratricopeptide repeat protein [Nafulsella turpanensis]